MKKLFPILAGIVVLVMASEAQAISLAEGSNSSGLKGPQAHSHITTTPILITSIVVTPTKTNGYVQIVETLGANVSNNYISVNKVLADIQGATANVTVAVNYGDGLAVGGNLFVDCNGAYAEVHYKR